MARWTPVGDGTFEADFSRDTDARFDLVIDEGRKTEQEEEADIQRILEKEGYASAEASFLSGVVQYVISSNVHAIQYLYLNPDLTPLNQLYVTYKDGSLYAYYDVPVDVALELFHASSYGKAVWSLLRQRGTVYGHQFSYALVSGSRVWYDAGVNSQARHESLGRAGEPSMPDGSQYHPSLNWRGAPGKAGKKNAGKNLNARGGSKKAAAFTPIQSSVGHINPAGPFS